MDSVMETKTHPPLAVIAALKDSSTNHPHLTTSSSTTAIEFVSFYHVRDVHGADFEKFEKFYIPCDEVIVNDGEFAIMSDHLTLQALTKGPYIGAVLKDSGIVLKLFHEVLRVLMYKNRTQTGVIYFTDAQKYAKKLDNLLEDYAYQLDLRFNETFVARLAIPDAFSKNGEAIVKVIKRIFDITAEWRDMVFDFGNTGFYKRLENCSDWKLKLGTNTIRAMSLPRTPSGNPPRRDGSMSPPSSPSPTPTNLTDLGSLGNLKNIFNKDEIINYVDGLSDSDSLWDGIRSEPRAKTSTPRKIKNMTPQTKRKGGPKKTTGTSKELVQKTVSKSKPSKKIIRTDT